MKVLGLGIALDLLVQIASSGSETNYLIDEVGDYIVDELGNKIPES